MIDCKKETVFLDSLLGIIPTKESFFEDPVPDFWDLE